MRLKFRFEKKSGKLAWLAWTVAVVFYAFEYLVRVIPSVMEKELAVQFSASAATMAIALGAYYFVYAPLQLFAGVLFDRFGGKAVLVPASILVSTGCLVSIVPAHSLVFVATGRILAGLGSSCAFIGTMYLAAVWFHERRLAFLSGLTTSIGICGALLGEAPLSLMVDRCGWEKTFAIVAIVGILITSAIAVYIPETPRWELAKRRMVSDSRSMKGFLAGLVSVCRNRQTWAIGLVASFLYMPTVAFGDLWGVRYMECSMGLPKAEAAQVASMLYIGWLVGSPLAGLLSDVIGCRKKLLTTGCLLSTVLFSVVLLCPIKSPATVGAMLFLAGMASTPQVICFVASLEVNEERAKGSAIAVVNMIVMFVGGLFQTIVGVLMGENASHAVSSEAFRNALLAMPIFTFVGVLVSFFIKNENRARD
jgi:MFS family permease